MKRGRATGASSSGQTTVEYILLIATAVTFFLMVSRVLIQPLYQTLSSAITGQLQSKLSGSAFYNFPL